MEKYEIDQLKINLAISKYLGIETKEEDSVLYVLKNNYDFVINFGDVFDLFLNKNNVTNILIANYLVNDLNIIRGFDEFEDAGFYHDLVFSDDFINVVYEFEENRIPQKLSIQSAVAVISAQFLNKNF